MSKEELEQIQKKALEQFTSGKSLFGKDGAFVRLLKLMPKSIRNHCFQYHILRLSKPPQQISYHFDAD
jgi:hypothetical protein